MQILDNVRNTVKDDLQVTIKKGSKISVLLKRKNTQGKPRVLYFPYEPRAQHLRNRI